MNEIEKNYLSIIMQENYLLFVYANSFLVVKIHLYDNQHRVVCRNDFNDT